MKIFCLLLMIIKTVFGQPVTALIKPLTLVCMCSNPASVPSALCLELELYLLSGCDVMLA